MKKTAQGRSRPAGMTMRRTLLIGLAGYLVTATAMLGQSAAVGAAPFA